MEGRWGEEGGELFSNDEVNYQGQTPDLHTLISFKPTPHCVGALEASLVLWAPPLRLALPHRSALTVPAPRHLQSGPPFFRILSVFQFEGHSSLPSPPFSRPTLLSRSQQVLLILRLPRSTLSGGVRPTTDFHLLSTHHPNIGSAYVLTP